MANGINKVILVGNIGSDPELRVTPAGQTLLKFSLATTERYVTKSGEKKETTEWHKCTVWGKTAEALGKFLAKGAQVYAEGSIKTDTYEKDGQKRYSTGITVNQLQVLSSKKDGARGSVGPSASENDASEMDEDPDVAAAMAGKPGATPPPF